jgi:hypothetical protein
MKATSKRNTEGRTKPIAPGGAKMADEVGAAHGKQCFERSHRLQRSANTNATLGNSHGRAYGQSDTMSDLKG